jgi:hypothetical protein
MQSPNKRAMTQAERTHVERIKEMSCVLCDAAGPSEAHELKQGQWFTSTPLCVDCHRGSVNGWHGQRRLWAVRKWEELDALNETIRRLIV